MSENSSPREVRLRLLPAIVVVAIEIIVWLGFKQFASINMQSVYGNAAVPLIGTIVLLLWWLFASRAPWLDKLVGFGIMAVIVALIVLTQAKPYNGGIHLAGALPWLGAIPVAAMLLGASLPWGVRRVLVAVALIACGSYFLAQRVTGVSSDFVAFSVWRWDASSIGTLAAEKGTAKLPAAVSVTDWPGFRGPNRDARVTGLKFATDWSSAPPKLLWKHPVGAGHSSMAVVGDYLFTQEQNGDQELVTCYAVANGDPVWTNSITVKHDDAMGGEGPRATPTYANGKLYVQSAGGLFQCLDAANGSVVWKTDLTTKEAPAPPMYGFSSSPLVVGDLVVPYADGAGRGDMVAFNAATGAEVWKAAAGTGGYGSPQLATIDSVPQILLLDSSGIQGYDPAKGTLLWEHVWKKMQFPRCVQPLLDGEGGIALGATTDLGTRQIHVKKTDTAWEVKEVWTNAKHRPYFNDDVGFKGFMYGFDGNRLCCLDLKTGEKKWEGARYGGQVMVVDDMDMLLVLTEKGEAALVKADPAAFTEVATFNAIHGKTWNHPAIANGKLFARNSEEMACYNLTGSTKTASTK